jgi:hypothetical protein
VRCKSGLDPRRSRLYSCGSRNERGPRGASIRLVVRSDAESYLPSSFWRSTDSERVTKQLDPSLFCRLTMLKRPSHPRGYGCCRATSPLRRVGDASTAAPRRRCTATSPAVIERHGQARACMRPDLQADVIMSAYRSSVAFVNSTSTGPASISPRKPWLCVPVYSNANERHSLSARPPRSALGRW